MPRSGKAVTTKTAKPSQSRRNQPSAPAQASEPEFQRILVGVRLEERLVKVLKGLAELKDYTLGELLEEISLTAMEGNSVFTDKNGKLPAETRQRIASLKQVYGVDYVLNDLHTRARSVRGRKAK